MLGTGNALATRYYNTCFLLRSGAASLLVDAGGGNQILSRLEQAHAPITELHHLFLTHAHTDHVLGAVWVVRAVMQSMRQGRYEGELHIYGNPKVVGVLEWICRNTLPRKLTQLWDEGIKAHVLHDGEEFGVDGWRLNCFDIHSTKEPQFGFRAVLTDGQKLVCLGDEPYNGLNRKWAEGADWLLCEAFCLHSDAERFHPYEKHHSTALDAARLATELGVRNLVLYHTEDKTGERKRNYTDEAATLFGGNIFVPDDMETVALG